MTKGESVTLSERYLSRLAEGSFLSLWSYPSPYKDQNKKGPNGHGEEICDLLVVCGPYIIIFSEKTCRWPKGSLDVAWRRWANRAIRKAAEQAAGAERWINEWPNRVFLDRTCKNPFPIKFPQGPERVFHRVVVANGAASQCKQLNSESSGSLMFRSDIQGDSHWQEEGSANLPFCIGDIDPTGSFVHVFNEITLDIVMQELDTVTDFVTYLDKKEKIIRSGCVLKADGEEHMLAHYVTHYNQHGDHDFISDGTVLKIDNSHYPRLVEDRRYIAKKIADKISYIWDDLIECFAKNMLDGTSVSHGTHEFDLQRNEIALRIMVLEPRLSRRTLGRAVKEALDQGVNEEQFFRMVVENKIGKKIETGYFVLTRRYDGTSTESREYDTYRKSRLNVAKIYARAILQGHPYLKRVIGIALEPPKPPHGGSEDMVYAEQGEWTREQRAEVRDLCQKHGIFQGSMKGQKFSDQEYPDMVTITVDPPDGIGP